MRQSLILYIYIMYNIAPIRHLKCPHKTMVIIIDTGPAAPFPWHRQPGTVSMAWHRACGGINNAN